jgi:hypothetical protein
VLLGTADKKTDAEDVPPPMKPSVLDQMQSENTEGNALVTNRIFQDMLDESINPESGNHVFLSYVDSGRVNQTRPEMAGDE